MGTAIVTCEKCGKEIAEGRSVCPQCEFPVSVEQIGPVYVPQGAQLPDAIPAVPTLSITPKQQIYAGFWLRVAAYLIDTIVIFLVLLPVVASYPTVFIRFPAASPPLAATAPQPTGWFYVVAVPIVWIYYALFEASRWQATPGKRILRLYVTDVNGRRITFGRAFVRNLAKAISGLPFLVGYLLAGFTEKKQALHDLLAGCLVLRRP